MYNLVRAEFYKLKCDKIYRIILIITGILILRCITLVIFKSTKTTIMQEGDGANTLGYIINSFKDIKNPTVMEIFNSAQGFSPVLQILIMFFVTSFVLNEYNYGTFKNSISVGSSRLKIYTSKLLTISFGIFIMNFFMLCGSTLFGMIFCKASGVFNNNTILQMFKLIMLSWIVLTAMASLYMCFSIIIKSKSIILALGIITIIFEPVILASKGFYKYGDYLLSFILMKICSVQLYGQAIYNIVLTSIIWIIITSIIGIFIFRRQDVK